MDYSLLNETSDIGVPVWWTASAISAVALLTLAVSGWLVGRLAYRYGVGVADEDTQLDGYLHNGHGRPA